MPPNTTYLLTDRLWVMVLLDVASALGGYLRAALLGPRHGVLPRTLRHRGAHTLDPPLAEPGSG